MSLLRSDSDPCIKCAGLRKRSSGGSVYCVDCNKRYKKENKDKILKRDRLYYREHKEQSQKTMKKYRENNKEKIREYENSKARKDYISQRAKRYNKEVRHPDYAVWMSMRNRCLNPTNTKFPRYGGRGIEICDSWLESFDNFIKDMGPRPEPRYKYSIERENVNGNYEPDNCRWATAKEQARNKSNTRFVRHERELIPLAEAAEKLGISYGAALYRFKKFVDENHPIEFEGKTITLKELSEKTGIDLKIVLSRAFKNTSVEFITALYRNVPTYLYNGSRYTVLELSILSGVPVRDLFDRLYKQKMSANEAISLE